MAEDTSQNSQERTVANSEPRPSTLKNFLSNQFDYSNFGLQDFLTLGYLYLLVLGILTEVFYYKLIGVNILYYSGLMDVLLSPLVFMTKKLAILAVLVILLFAVAVLDRYKRKEHAKLVEQNANSGDSEKQSSEFPKDFFIKISAIMVFFMFIGGGIGAGVSQSQKISSGDFECRDLLEFTDGETINVRIVGQNNDFVFFVEPGKNHVSVAPLRGNIKRIDRIPESQSNEKSEEQDKKSIHRDRQLDKSTFKKAVS